MVFKTIMTISYRIPSYKTLNARQLIAEGYRDAFTGLGHAFQFVETSDVLFKLIDSFAHDLFLTKTPNLMVSIP